MEKQNLRKQYTVNKELYAELKKIALFKGVSISKLVELSCYLLVDKESKKIKENYFYDDNIKNKKMNIPCRISTQAYKKLVKSAEENNTSLSNEIRYRLSATLDNPIYNTFELENLTALWLDLNRLGNLFKLAINTKTKIDNTQLDEVEKNLELLKDELHSIIMNSKERTL
ncbi:hypothetical protein QJU11_09980 [Pasteurella atlantica]|uniref:hypothetical protein n=1 Tax=Phocoenobacter atlanticus TaxID=3416742 RepID=UPI0027654BC9|nr:hypothetical protein [Pasteurella atlantica]MDP8042519.1 hypothetical protein [Pasteurella atlantica]